VVERARHLLTTTFWPPERERPGNISPARAWKAWLFGGLLIAAALGLIYLAIAPEL
jgi:hypothetical protein